MRCCHYNYLRRHHVHRQLHEEESVLNSLLRLPFSSLHGRSSRIRIRWAIHFAQGKIWIRKDGDKHPNTRSNKRVFGCVHESRHDIDDQRSHLGVENNQDHCSSHLYLLNSGNIIIHTGYRPNLPKSKITMSRKAARSRRNWQSRRFVRGRNGSWRQTKKTINDITIMAK